MRMMIGLVAGGKAVSDLPNICLVNRSDWLGYPTNLKCDGGSLSIALER